MQIEMYITHAEFLIKFFVLWLALCKSDPSLKYSKEQGAKLNIFSTFFYNHNLYLRVYIREDWRKDCCSNYNYHRA